MDIPEIVDYLVEPCPTCGTQIVIVELADDTTISAALNECCRNHVSPGNRIIGGGA